MNEAVPEQGDLIWIDAEPHAGHEYGGHNADAKNTMRPMLVMSGQAYNARTGMVVGFPITSKTHVQRPFQFELTGHKIHGHVMLTGMLGYDYLARDGKISDHASKKELTMALNAVRDIFDLMH